MEATFSSETSVDFQWTTRLYILEDRTLHNHRSEYRVPRLYKIISKNNRTDVDVEVGEQQMGKV
jgi:hypothetical protein